MVNEPRRLPTYPGEVYENRWYCLHCPQHRTDANSIRIHLGASHDIEYPAPGADYGDGEMVSLLQRQRIAWEREVPERFAVELESLRGADDFAFEVGEGR